MTCSLVITISLPLHEQSDVFEKNKIIKYYSCFIASPPCEVYDHKAEFKSILFSGLCKFESTVRRKNMDGKIKTVFTLRTKKRLLALHHAVMSHSHHFSDHHDVWSSLLVDSQDIQESHVPEYDIETIHRPPGDKGFSSTQSQAKANKEGHNGQKVG